MMSKRVPDRVHVVRTPEQDTGGFNKRPDGQTLEIVRMLAQISDKLKRSEAERYELLNELREYRKSLRDLEEKTETSDRSVQALAQRVKTTTNIDTEALQRQAKFERTLKATEDKMIQALAGQAVIDKRLSNTENKQVAIDQRLDQSVSEQARLDRQLELTSQDKSRMLRKVERLEEIVTETKDALNSKAMVLLTDQSSAAQARLAAPSWNQNPEPVEPAIDNRGWWERNLTTQNLGMASMIVAALLTGWAINQMQQPNIDAVVIPDSLTSSSTITPSNVSLTPAASTNVPENVVDYNDDQLLEALNNDPEQLAAQLNAIEPSAVDATTSSATPETLLSNPQITPQMKDFDELAFKQDPAIEKQILSQQSSLPLDKRVTADGTLPDTVRNIEAEALTGNAEAQHDLAAIYTAGHGGVDQNFEKAAFWFLEASDNGIANARYNLGVLSHQGLGTERDLDKALYWYREAAKLNHAEAQYNLGIAHIEGIGTNYDPRLAAAFFERAANNGIMEASYNLGLIYDNGLMGEAKPDEALLWYKIAADQGSTEAKTAMEQLVKRLQIGMDDVDNLVERMQQINQSVKGRRAGPQKS